ncbi:hypothetical protein RCH12_002020 [Cryobacterium sp. MP_3.1]|uniref:DUF1254 domain-containing protein n=1 Tax=Cryobacterium sp. MP_3.1 TaxID=3071711 RepID=UPI002E09824F|nr:hypothetical protein [Cryobacterium sp. MP_3.1]
MSTLSIDPKTLAEEAYLYLYPLVLMEVTRQQSINTAPGRIFGRGPENTFVHTRSFPAAEFRDVVRPNFDTLYSIAWLELGAGPVVIHLPDTADRYYLLPLIDMWTEVFANPGKRTTGTAALDILVVPPGWSGEPPDGHALIQAPTPHVWVVGRFQTNGVDDYPVVRALQDQLSLTLPPEYVEFPLDPTVDSTTPPLRTVAQLSGVEFFRRAASALRTVPVHGTDFSVLARIRHLGIVPGLSFDSTRLDAADTALLEDGVAEARATMLATLPLMGRRVNGWLLNVETMGNYGNDYLKRAVVALVGLGANPPEDAVYPILMTDADGRPLDGGNRYRLHFERHELPPVDAFWSLTMYDADGFPAANPIDRYAIGDRDALHYNADGSLDLVLQHERPADDLIANWLPAPLGPLGVTMRLYGPRREVLDGAWVPPAVTRLEVRKK